MDNFIEAGKKLRGEPFGPHKGYVFANAYVHNAVESMSIALMLDTKTDAELTKAQDHMRATLDRWIPIILAAQEPEDALAQERFLPLPCAWGEFEYTFRDILGLSGTSGQPVHLSRPCALLRALDTRGFPGCTKRSR